MDTYEKAEPKNWLILGSAVISVTTLVALVPAFHAYYDESVTGAVALRAITHPDSAELEQARAEWAQGLCLDGRACRGTSIDDAIRGFAGRDRANDPRVRPAVTEPMNYRPLIGWNGRPDEAWRLRAEAAALPPVVEEPVGVDGALVPEEGVLPPADGVAPTDAPPPAEVVPPPAEVLAPPPVNRPPVVRAPRPPVVPAEPAEPAPEATE